TVTDLGLFLLLSLAACESSIAQGTPDTEAKESCDVWASAPEEYEGISKRNLAYCFWSGVGRPKDLVKAEELLRESVASGNTTAVFDLGTLLVFEDACSANDIEGLALLREAMDRGYRRAGYQLGLVYWGGLAGQSADVEAAVENFVAAAEYNSIQAQFLLFCIYSLGMRGLPADPSQAGNWRQRLETSIARNAIPDLADLRRRLLADERFTQYAVNESELEKIGLLDI
ncbi:MAG: tetratricopeptide repeat protein, partial [Pseudomonadota bacterium]